MTEGWNDIVSPETGKLLVKEDAVQVLHEPEQWYPFAHQAYGMMWMLAMQLGGYDRDTAEAYIQDAHDSYVRGSALSRGIDGRLNPTFKEKPEDADY